MTKALPVVLAQIALLALAYVAAYQLPPGRSATATLGAVLVLSFVAFACWSDLARREPLLAIAFVATWITLFRFLGRFERLS